MMIIWPYLVGIVSSLLWNTKGEDIPTLVPGGPVSDWVGSSVILPVQVTPPRSVVEYIVHWSRFNQLDESIEPILFENQNSSSLGKDYGRARFVGNLYEGDVSMQLINITLEDSGKYICSVENPEKWKLNITINLTVEAMGSIPWLSFSDAAGSELVNVTCESDGWNPEPTVIWNNSKGEDLSNRSSSVFRVHPSGNTSLINVSSWVLVSPSESYWVSCSVGISDLNRRESRIRPHTHAFQIGDYLKPFFWGPAIGIFCGGMVAGMIMGIFIGLHCNRGKIQCPGNQNITEIDNEKTSLTSAEETAPSAEEQPEAPQGDAATQEDHSYQAQK